MAQTPDRPRPPAAAALSADIDVDMASAPASSSPSTSWQLPGIVDELRQARADWRAQQGRAREVGSREFPSTDALRGIIADLCGALFPMRLGPPELRKEGEDYYVGHTLNKALHALLEQVRLELRYAARQQPADGAAIDRRAAEVVREFAHALPMLRRLLDSDVMAAYQGDPAARSVDEVLLCYPGVRAIIHYRLAHELYRRDVPMLARMVSELAHSETGIDIHPGARIGGGFFIDHGTGVVIGETAIIGEQVRLYQAVTLGAKRFHSDADGTLRKGQPRHPIVEDNVVIYAGATILGRITIGRGSTIGGNVWLTHSVPPGSHVAQADTQQTVSGQGGAAG